MNTTTQLTYTACQRIMHAICAEHPQFRRPAEYWQRLFHGDTIPTTHDFPLLHITSHEEVQS